MSNTLRAYILERCVRTELIGTNTFPTDILRANWFQTTCAHVKCTRARPLHKRLVCVRITYTINNLARCSRNCKKQTDVPPGVTAFKSIKSQPLFLGVYIIYKHLLRYIEGFKHNLRANLNPNITRGVFRIRAFIKAARTQSTRKDLSGLFNCVYMSIYIPISNVCIWMYVCWSTHTISAHNISIPRATLYWAD